MTTTAFGEFLSKRHSKEAKDVPSESLKFDISDLYQNKRLKLCINDCVFSFRNKSKSKEWMKNGSESLSGEMRYDQIEGIDKSFIWFLYSDTFLFQFELGFLLFQCRNWSFGVDDLILSKGVQKAKEGHLLTWSDVWSDLSVSLLLLFESSDLRCEMWNVIYFRYL